MADTHRSAASEREPVAFINNRLADLAEANALYGKDQRLGAPDKIARNEREISWLKDLRSLIVTTAPAQSVQVTDDHCAAQVTTLAHDVRQRVIEECAKVVDDFDCHLAGYPNDEAQQYYESGVADACNLVAEHIRALAAQPPAAPVERTWDQGSHEGCGVDSERAYARWSAGTATAWRVWWVSLNTARTELFEDHDAALRKAAETGGCVIALFSHSPQGARK